LLKLTVYIPEPALEKVKAALFEAGAGRSGLYDRCCWLVKGEGQFRPLPGSEPAIGKIGETAHVDEYKLETLLPAELAADVEAAIRRAHPYEEPAYDFIELYQVRNDDAKATLPASTAQ
tara:strand:+ start:27809 stop:28165 length:357 start_codon:yes stop_codon:yes gene_type:complete